MCDVFPVMNGAQQRGICRAAGVGVDDQVVRASKWVDCVTVYDTPVSCRGEVGDTSHISPGHLPFEIPRSAGTPRPSTRAVRDPASCPRAD